MAPMPARTIFFESHLAHGAKMIDFGGWEMPIHYGSQISEHLHTRTKVSMFDVSHMAVVDVFGEDTERFLKFLLANNVEKIKGPGRSLYSCMLNNEGGIIDDLIVYHLPDRYRLVINASTAATDLLWIEEQAKSFNHIEIVPRRDGLNGCQNPEVLLAIQGPDSLPALINAFPSSMPPFYQRNLVRSCLLERVIPVKMALKLVFLIPWVLLYGITLQNLHSIFH